MRADVEAMTHRSGALPSHPAIAAELLASDAELRTAQEHATLLQRELDAARSAGTSRVGVHEANAELSELSFLRTQCARLLPENRSLRRELMWLQAAPPTGGASTSDTVCPFKTQTLRF